MEIYYINLDRSTGRRNHMEAQFDRLNLSYARVPAIEETKLTSEELKSVDWQDPRAAALPVGANGCFLSHRKAWELIANGPDRYGVVMEDDVYLSEHSVFFLNDESWIPEATPIVRLETMFLRVPMGMTRWTGTVAGNRFKLRGCKLNRIERNKGGFGAACYIVHRQYASWLTEKFSRFSWIIDAEIYDAENFGRSSTNSIKGAPLQLVPAIAVQQQCSAEVFLPPDAEVSTIGHRRAAQSNSPAQLIVRELRRACSLSHWKRQLFGRRVPLLK